LNPCKVTRVEKSVGKCPGKGMREEVSKGCRSWWAEGGGIPISVTSSFPSV
jgi:hypothetical protein